MCRCRVVDVDGRKVCVCVGEVEEEVVVFVLDGFLLPDRWVWQCQMSSAPG